MRVEAWRGTQPFLPGSTGRQQMQWDRAAKFRQRIKEQKEVAPHMSIVPVDTNNDTQIGIGRKNMGLRVAGLAAAISFAACGGGNPQTQEANITPNLVCNGSNQIKTGETGPYTLTPGDPHSKVIVDLREVTSPKPGVIEVAERPDLSDTAYVTSDKKGYVDHNGFNLSLQPGEVLKISSNGEGTITEIEPGDQFSLTASKTSDGRTAVSVSGKCTDN